MLDLGSLFKLSYGMCIVSSEKGGRLNGCIVNTVFQLTPEPPMKAVSINRENLTHAYITDSKVFTVSILAQETPKRFFGKFGFRSGRDIDKFQDVNYRIGVTGGPIDLDYSVAFVEVEVSESVEIGTHTLFIGKITACETIDDSKIPMTYAYCRDVKHGRTPERAATYQKVKTKPETTKGVAKMKKYKCLLCGYIYDPVVGDPDNGVEAGTAFEDLPDGWVCPDCGAGQDDFKPVEE